MMNDARATYLNASIATASPTKLLVMLCERLVLDVQRAGAALDAGDHAAAHQQLTHAQDIVMELHTSLRPEGFAGGNDLAALYGYLHRQLVTANIRKDAAITAECLRLATAVSDTWREAALQSAAPATATRSA